MEALIKPEFGLMFWTISIFILLVVLLSKTAWAPLIKAVEERERSLRHDREAAEKARAESEKIKAELEARLAELKAEVGSQLEQARAQGAREREQILEHTLKAGAAMLETAKNEIEAQRREMAKELKDKVAGMALLAAEKVLLRSVDQKSNTELVDRFLKELEAKDAKYRL
ncbi:MAG: ATP synthase F0 subunit B [Elusimicrobia bacterium RIFOXYB2_FULL_62_6]|nr:MAG: ATP synthase F0 subunit B [Elusimicrobia bacterium RIFOXYB2_FULL_62_6]